MFDNILVYIDHNLAYSSLLACVLNVAKTHRAKVTLMGTVPSLDNKVEYSLSEDIVKEIYDDQYTKVQVALDNFTAQLELAHIESDTLISVGTPFIEICRQVQQNDQNLVMLLADKHQSGLSKVFFGSTQMHLLRKCPTAVWIVKSNSMPVAQHILAPIDVGFVSPEESDINTAIVETARVMAQKGNMTVEFMHVWTLFGESYFSGRGGLSKLEIKKLRKKRKVELGKKLRKLVRKAEWVDLDVALSLPRNEAAASQIVKSVKKNNIDLLIMGTLCRTGIEGFFIGNTAEKILNEVSCSVLALKPQGFKSPVS
ncbi:MAG: universal stress protein E [Gammaproteobacteria bacterium]|jgi:universal stress protein E